MSMYELESQEIKYIYLVYYFKTLVFKIYTQKKQINENEVTNKNISFFIQSYIKILNSQARPFILSHLCPCNSYQCPCK